MSDRGNTVPRVCTERQCRLLRRAQSRGKPGLFALPSGSATRAPARTLARTQKTRRKTNPAIPWESRCRSARSPACSDAPSGPSASSTCEGTSLFPAFPYGKLMFFHNQIVRWVLEMQRQRGGIFR